MMRRWLTVCAPLVFILAIPTPANTHELGLAQITIEKAGDGVLNVGAKVQARVLAVDPAVPEGCVIIDRVDRPLPPVSQTIDWVIDCSKRLVRSDDAIKLPWKIEGAMVQVERGGNLEEAFYLRASQGAIQIPLDRLDTGSVHNGAILSEYFLLGTEHILSGIDHLALVLCLCLLASGWRLVKLVTAFTVGHSITLGLGAMGWITVPTIPLEAVIALSIAFLAREAFRSEPHASSGFMVVAAFGLLHGLGFASALADVGLPESNLVLALLAFNLGVEAGQILFVAAIVTIAWLARPIPMAGVPIRRVTAAALGSVAMYWTFDRLSGLLA